jgi:hypothetical protein
MCKFKITKIRNRNNGQIIGENALNYIKDVYSFYYLYNEKSAYSIHEVKRISDGATFIVNEEIENSLGVRAKIKSFNLVTDIILEFDSFQTTLDGIKSLKFEDIEEHKSYFMLSHNMSKITYKGSGDPVQRLDLYIENKYGNIKFNQFLNKDDCRVRVLVFENP